MGAGAPFHDLTGYFDESGTHGGEVALMGGFMSDARQWRKFEKRTGKLFRRFKVDVFHNTDLRRGDGAFQGWKVDRKIELLDELAHIANETVMNGFVSILKYEDYKFYENLPWPKGTRKDPCNTLLFRACLAGAIDQVAKAKRDGKEPSLYIVLESGHKNAPDAVRAYEYFAKMTGNKNALAGLTFKGKLVACPWRRRTCWPIAPIVRKPMQSPWGWRADRTSPKPHIGETAIGSPLAERT